MAGCWGLISKSGRTNEKSKIESDRPVLAHFNEISREEGAITKADGVGMSKFRDEA